MSFENGGTPKLTTETSSPGGGGTGSLASEESLMDASGVHWGLARRARTGLDYLELVRIEKTDTGPSIFARLKIVCGTSIFSHEDTIWTIWRPICHSLAVYKAIVIKASKARSNTDIEAQGPCEVFTVKKERSRTYTEALRDPSILETTPNFIENRAEYNLATTSAKGTKYSAPFPVLLVVREIDRNKLLLVFLGLCVISVVVGCVVGFSTHHADWGIEVASGLFAFLAILQIFCVWASS